MSMNGKAYSLRAVVLGLMLALLATGSAFAQALNTAKVEGVVRDADTGQPLAGVQVVIEGTRLGNVTNSDGYYFVLNASPGRRSVTFSYTGYQKTSPTSPCDRMQHNVHGTPGERFTGKKVTEPECDQWDSI